MMFLDVVIRINIRGLIANRISLFLLTDTKGKRIQKDKTVFYNLNKNKYDFILIFDFLIDEYQSQLFLALENPYSYFSKNISIYVYGN